MPLLNNCVIEPGSFRDPSGFLFYKNNSIYRQINSIYKTEYDLLLSSGLYKNLVESKLLIPHEELEESSFQSFDGSWVIKPEMIPFITYPYEWCFSQLKDAALLTIEIQKRALKHGMSLKDSSAYNVQFRKGQPIFIDTLSFEKHNQGLPWTAYRQFCQHFLAPLALMSCKDIRLGQLLKIHIDGIPLDLASSLLPFHTRFNFSLLIHIHLHARAQKHFSSHSTKTVRGNISNLSMMGLLDSLETCVKKLRYKTKKTEWGDYYRDTNYTSDGFEHKKELISAFLGRIKPEVVWDLGSNTGIFSRIASGKKIQTLSFDSDPLAVQKNYIECVAAREECLLPLLLDLANPSPGIGWGNKERKCISNRGNADTVMALALIHHLAISNNLPFDLIAEYFSKICSSLIIEFVPKNDSQVQRILASRKDIFSDYTKESFEESFIKFFTIIEQTPIKDSKRTLYMMTKKLSDI